MKKNFVTFMMLFDCLASFAQATDLVVDCQTPGGLSSKINYGDQQTVKNLKVTGYVNDTDLKFILTLLKTNLDGTLDLGDVEFVGDSWEGLYGGDSWNGLFGGPLSVESDIQIHKLVYPKNLTSYHERRVYKTNRTEYCEVFPMSVDSLIFDTKVKAIDSETFYVHRKINHLIIGESVESIGNNAFSGINTYRTMQSVTLPSSLKTIGKKAFEGVFEDLSQSNIANFPSLESLDDLAFVNYFIEGRKSNKETLPDTIFLPKIVGFSVSAFEFKEGMHIYLGEGITVISCYTYNTPYSESWIPSLNNVTFHIAAKTPPRLYCSLTGATIFVPKDAVDDYKQAGGSWKNANILPEPQPLKEIKIDKHLVTMEINEQVQLVASPIPANADDITILWNSDNKESVIVNNSGMITAISPGRANIIAMSSDGEIRDTCVVTVNAHAESIIVEPKSIVLSAIGDTTQLTATISPLDAVDKTITWKSSNEQVCLVSATGLVTATGAGSAVVTATTVDGGFEATCLVKVIQHVTGVSMEKNSTLLKVGENEQLKAVVNPDNADDKSIEWYSSNKQIATVDANGNVTAITAGDVWVKAVSKDNKEAKDSCKVTVVQPVSGINLTKTNVILNAIGESYQLEAVVLPEDASDKSVRWKSSNEQVCSVSNNGLVTATGAGSTIVTATTVDGAFEATCVVKVIQHVTSLTLDKATLTLKVGESEKLQATIMPDNADNKAVNFSSSDSLFASVDAQGFVKALKAGEVWISAISEDNPNAKASCKVTIIQPTTGVTISYESYKMTMIGESFKLEATVLPEDATNKNVTWKSSNETVCNVINGLVITVGYGTSVVTVTTEDGGYLAYCIITVEQPVNGIENVSVSTSESTPVYDTMGRKVKELKKGQLYIKNGKKFIAK